MVSIIIPTFNSASTIRAALESIVNQTYKNIEILVLDNISKDDTCNIVNEFIEKFPNIILLSEKDRGVYDAMNKGIQLSKGDFLYFMGSDDVFYANDTLDLIFTKENLSYDIIYGNVEFKKSKKIYSGESSLSKLMESQISICHQAIFYSKRTFNIIGNYNLKYFIHADYDFNIRCFKNEELKIKYINIIIAIFNEAGLSGVNSNADGFHTELTEFNLSQNYNIIGLFEENKKLKNELNNISKSKEFKIGTLLLKPLKKIKKLIFK
ncbi:glycosyltransferase family 2 protein [Aequorivita todarodis]|uniref:glycosyltransferase family 2 protein n=1 Tax=Aequorivita todarodis TaxID=2036821 RepID=UPI002350F7F5|nr:glycosyltransferase family 2 protein [Aequorivita todarodis]MDC8000593.1 glycosyltransferase family 2 protein [Aequorivita todarodis]